MADSLFDWYYNSTLSDGLLPKWIFFLALLSLFNSAQNYTTMKFTTQIYCGPSGNPATSPATPLSARTFGTWTLASAIVRVYAALHLTDPLLYDLAIWILAIAFSHFVIEWQVFRTCSWGRGLAGPLTMSTITLVWMWLQRDEWVG